MMLEHKTIPQRVKEHDRELAELRERVAALEAQLAKAKST